MREYRGQRPVDHPSGERSLTHEEAARVESRRAREVFAVMAAFRRMDTAFRKAEAVERIEGR
jgi:hypothetical protein